MKNFTASRKRLVEAGWKRQDRNNLEWWQPPWDGRGFPPGLVTYATAMRHLNKAAKAAASTP